MLIFMRLLCFFYSLNRRLLLLDCPAGFEAPTPREEFGSRVASQCTTPCKIVTRTTLGDVCNGPRARWRSLVKTFMQRKHMRVHVIRAY